MRATTTSSREDPETSSDSTSIVFAVKFIEEVLLEKQTKKWMLKNYYVPEKQTEKVDVEELYWRKKQKKWMCRSMHGYNK